MSWAMPISQKWPMTAKFCSIFEDGQRWSWEQTGWVKDEDIIQGSQSFTSPIPYNRPPGARLLTTAVQGLCRFFRVLIDLFKQALSFTRRPLLLQVPAGETLLFSSSHFHIRPKVFSESSEARLELA
jgi:hypothetical protein